MPAATSTSVCRSTKICAPRSTRYKLSSKGDEKTCILLGVYGIFTNKPKKCKICRITYKNIWQRGEKVRTLQCKPKNNLFYLRNCTYWKPIKRAPVKEALFIIYRQAVIGKNGRAADFRGQLISSSPTECIRRPVYAEINNK